MRRAQTKMTKAVLATNNPGKLQELRALLADLPAALVSPTDLGLELQVAEVGETYTQNATLKARAFAQAAGLIALADDSGLEVEVLDGLPGLRSARFAPWPGASDADRRAYLLSLLQAYPRPWPARFRCVAAVVTPAGQVLTAEGVCPGLIIPHEHGTQGFGYDPIFYLPALGLTMAELDMETKNRISHRGRAIAALRPALIALLDPGRRGP